MPDIYLDTDTYNQAQGDLWERDQLNGLADRWASQATATLPSRVADAQDRVAEQQQASNQAAADQWEQQATAQYVTPEARPESVAGDQSVGTGSQTGLADAGSISDNASPPAAQPPDIQPPAMTSVPQDQPVQMGPMETAAPVAPTPQQPAVPATSAPVTASLQQPAATGYETMARLAAQQNGLDPDVFVRQLTQESGLQPYNPDGTVKTSPAGARGVAQFMPDTARGLGINPDDPAQAIPAAAQYMAGLLKQNGGDYSRALAAYNAGQGNVDKFGGVPPFAETQKYVSNILSGAGQAIQQKAQDVAQAVQNVGGQVASRVSQFALGLSSADAAAFCGPAAAIAFAKTYGRNPTADEAKALAAQVGWNPSQGMAGVQSEQKLLQSMGVPTTLESTVDWGHVAQDAAGGNPVILDTPGHYYYVDGVKQGPNGEQQFHVGTSGTDLRGGGEWMTSAQINAMPQSGGAVRAALYADHPMGPGQSIASASSPTDMQTASLPTPDTGQQPIGSPPRQEWSMFDPLKQLGDTISSAITTGLQSLFGTSDQSNPIAQAITPNLTDPTRSVFGNNPVPTTQQPSTTGMAAQAAFGTPQQPRGPNEALTAGEQALGQNVVAPVLNAVGQPGGALRDQRQGLADALTSATQDSPIPGVAGVGQAIGGMIAAPTPLDSIQTVQDLTAKYPSANGLPNIDAMTPEDQQRFSQASVAVGGIASPLSHSADPLIQKTGQMLEAGPPAPATDNLVNRLVRATTNRFEAADRYQQDAINQVGLNPANPPQDLDLSAALRMQSSPAAEVRIQQELAPAIQTVGEQDRNWLSAYLMHANNVDVANALGNPDRTFPGGFKASDSQQVLGALPNELGPQRWQNVQDAAQQIYSFTGSLRQRMVDSGLISQQTASDWATKYPHWVPTRVLDYMDEAGGPKVGTKISLADNGVRQYTEDGTARFAEDPLASLVGLAQQVESKAMRNEAANAIVLLDQIRGPGNQLLTKTDRPVQANETVIQRINNGTVERYVAPPELAAVINGPAITQAPAFVRAWTGFLRSVTTVLSPAFALVRNPMLDIPEYMTRELARGGGNPLQLPHILGELAQGYADAFKGYRPLTEGKFAGPGAQEFMLSGGGGSGLASNTFANRADAVARLAQDGHVLGSAADVGRVLKDLVTLKPVARTAERTELGPRIASMRLAQQRGATQARATLAGRTVTLDFNEGGTVAKTINQFVPFFNAGIQGSMAVPRMIGEHPVGAVASMMMTAGLPAVAAEAWNNADPQRAKDYADVPDYLKQQGVVVMMPGDAPTDDRGNRRPQFWWINMRGMAPLSSIAREATGRVMQAAGNGNVQPEDWQHLVGDSLFGMSPIRANTVADVPGSLSPQFVPGADVGLQLMLNKDIFRGSDIVTPRKDQYASAVGKSIANGLTSVARLQNPAAQVHPSQVDFTLQQMLGGVGSSIMGASNAIAGQRSDDAPQSAPVLGGLVRAAGVRGDTGQVLQDARAQVLEPEAQRVLNDAGLPIPLPQPGTIHVQGFGVPLHQDEQARYQQLYSQLSSQLIVRYASQLRSAQNLLVRQQLLSRINDIARTQAEQQILSTIPGPQVTQRVRDENARQAAGIR